MAMYPAKLNTLVAKDPHAIHLVVICSEGTYFLGSYREQELNEFHAKNGHGWEKCGVYHAHHNEETLIRGGLKEFKVALKARKKAK